MVDESEGEGEDECTIDWRDTNAFPSAKEALFGGREDTDVPSTRDLRGSHESERSATKYLREQRQHELEENERRIERWRGIVKTDETVEERMALLRGRPDPTSDSDFDSDLDRPSERRGSIKSDNDGDGSATRRLREKHAQDRTDLDQRFDDEDGDEDENDEQ